MAFSNSPIPNIVYTNEILPHPSIAGSPLGEAVGNNGRRKMDE